MVDECTKDEAIFEWIKGTVRASTPGVKKEMFEKAFAKEETVTAIDAFLAGDQPALLFHGDILTGFVINIWKRDDPRWANL